MKRRQFIGLLGTAAVSLSATARAQQAAMPVIGYFHFATPEYTPSAAPFLQGLSESGYIEGKNVTIEHLLGKRYAFKVINEGLELYKSTFPVYQ